MPKKVIDLQAIREAEARLKQVVEEHPELRDPARQEALADWLETLDEVRARAPEVPMAPEMVSLREQAVQLMPPLRELYRTAMEADAARQFAAAVQPVLTLLYQAIGRCDSVEERLQHLLEAHPVVADWLTTLDEEEADDGEER